MLLRELQGFLDACLQCIQDCERLLAEGRSNPGFGDCAGTCRDCADICQLCVYLVLQKAAIHARSYRICAELCLQCADLCARFGAEIFQKCAQSCRLCADLCLRMAGLAAA